MESGLIADGDREEEQLAFSLEQLLFIPDHFYQLDKMDYNCKHTEHVHQ